MAREHKLDAGGVFFQAVRKNPGCGALWAGKNGEPLCPDSCFGIMGILNLTPDSFYDGGKFADVATALQGAGRLLAEGADILDLGAESSRPGSKPLTAQAEWTRLAPALAAIRARFPKARLSIDTWHAETAAKALESGADIINDISACAYEPELLEVIASHKPAYVLMHSQGRPETMQNGPRYENVVDETRRFFETGLAMLVKAGLPENRVALDAGIGFGKTLEHNLALLAEIETFLEFGRPILAGLSMKSMFGDLLGLPLGERGPATAAASALLWQKGVFWHRVHNVRQTRDALRIAQAFGHFHKENAMPAA